MVTPISSHPMTQNVERHVKVLQLSFNDHNIRFRPQTNKLEHLRKGQH